MNRTSHKCQSCKKSFVPIKIDQKYCSSRCRQAGYRKRMRGGLRVSHAVKDKTPMPALPMTCGHCGGDFWARSKRAQFCSTSCRTLHHRAMKAAIPVVIEKVYGVPADKAQDLADTQPVRKLREVLTTSGFAYVPSERQWIKLAKEK